MSDAPAGRGARVAGAVLLGAGAVVCLMTEVSGAMALALGAALGLLGLNPWARLTEPLAGMLLQLAVIGLGAGMNLAVIWSVGVSGVGYTMVGIAVTFGLGLWLGRRAGLSRDLSLLLTSGTAICGGSAIAAVAGVLRPKPAETTVALATVFLLNAVALIVFPPLGHFAGLGQHAFGLWAALAIHDTSSVVGAATAYGPEALTVATTVKLTRALWIAPLALVIGWWVARRAGAQGVRGPVTVPWFILGFLGAATLVTLVPTLAHAGQLVAVGAKRALVVTLFLIGANLTRGALALVGWRPLAVSVVLWLTVSAATLGAILAGWIR